MSPWRVLWVKPGGLWPLETGGRLRSFHILSELSRRHHGTVLPTHGPEDDPQGLKTALPDCAQVVSLPHVAPKQRSRGFALSVARSWISRLPADISRWRVPALRKHVTDLMTAGSVDVCVADFLVSVPHVPVSAATPTVLFEHNVEHVIWKRLSQVESRVWRRALLEIEWRKMRAYERWACEVARLTVAVSDVDRAALAALAPRAMVEVIPTGVDHRFFAPNGIHERAANLVFSGSMDWHPNEDAILYFLSAILPRVRAILPETTFTVVGRRPSDRLRRAATATRVQVTGTVQDIRPYVAEAGVYVVPLRIGGGTRLKIFEALAMGKAVVSTGVGAEGLPLIPGTHFLQADDPASFADAVVSLVRDSARRRELGLAGRRLVEERHSWAQVAREFEAQCEKVIVDHAH